MKEDFKEYLENDDSYFSEGHLLGWFNTQYLGLELKEAKYKLEMTHDTICEIENAENELKRELDEEEREQLIKRFNEAVLNSLVCKKQIIVAFIDSLGEVNVRGYN